MGKNRQRHNRIPSSSDAGSNTKQAKSSSIRTPAGAAQQQSSSTGATRRAQRSSFFQWVAKEQQGLTWVLGCAFVGALVGFFIGTGHLTGGHSEPVTLWRRQLGRRVRSTTTYKLLTFTHKPWTPVTSLLKKSMSYSGKNLMGNPGNPLIFEILRESIQREKGGFVHPDLGMLIPAPSGAARGLGMIKDSYQQCQSQCIPGIAQEKQIPGSNKMQKLPYKQEEVLIRVPLSFQMTRNVALDTLLPLIPANDQNDPLAHLDDAALLVLLLAHERGLSRATRWLPYIASLPTEPSCGYSAKLRPYMLDAIAAYGEELGLDVNVWPREFDKAGKYAEKIASSLARDYGSYIQSPEGLSVQDNLMWALCQVASRATAGSEKHGSLRMIPMLDMLNHDANAGGFVEFTGKERFANGNFVNATEEDSGAFVVRSLRHGRRKPLKKGQELMVNYNVPGYSPLDWMVMLGFVPPERWHSWQKIDAALPRVRSDGPLLPSVASSTWMAQKNSEL